MISFGRERVNACKMDSALQIFVQRKKVKS